MRLLAGQELLLLLMMLMIKSISGPSFIFPVTKHNHSMQLLKFVFLFVGKTITREHPELMRVPAPVLASTLEPEFLVVPSSSFSYDSPPSSASDRRVKEEGSKKERKTSTETPLADRAVSSSSSREETMASVPVSLVARSHTSVESQDSARGGKEAGDEGSHKRHLFDEKSQSSHDSHGYVSLASARDKKQPTDIQMDNNGFSSPLSPKRKFTGTSPLNSDIGMPFTAHSSTVCKTEPIITTLNNSAVEPVSLAAVASSVEHAQVKSSTSAGNVSGAQAPPMTVISLPNNVESSASPQKISSTKKPIILSRRSSRSSEQNIPQGLVVLVPTIEDAKRLIASTGGNSDGHTPVLVPQHMLNDMHSKKAVSEDERETQRQILGKRTLDMVSPPLSTQSKRPAVDSVVID